MTTIDPLIIAAHVFRVIALVLGLLGISGGVWLVIRECRRARRQTAENQRHFRAFHVAEAGTAVVEGDVVFIDQGKVYPAGKTPKTQSSAPYFTRHHLES